MVVEYKDDPGAPGPSAYTAAEKRARALTAQWTLILIAASGTLAVLYLVWR
jgi:hypothetical protein